MLRQFIGYSIFGTLAFAFDLGLIYLFTTVGMSYVVAVPLAFVIATTAHYTGLRKFVFVTSARTLPSGYGYFMLIMIGNAALVTVLVAALIEYGGVNLYIARVGVAAFIGIMSFFLNARYNFRTL